MKRRVTTALFSISMALAAVLWACSPASTTQMEVRRAKARPAVRHLGVSRPIREAVLPLAEQQQGRAIPLMPTPRAPSFGVDSVVQFSVAKTLPTAAGLNFDGLGDGVNGYSVIVAPADATGAAGATQYVQWANLAFTVFDKTTGDVILGPTPGNSLFSAFDGTGVSNCGMTNDGDPVVKYDAAAGQWILAQISRSLANPGAGVPYEECVAISTSSDATGSYNLYAIQYQALQPDAVKFGVWADAFYYAANLYLNGSFFGSQGCALDPSVFLSGAPTTPSSIQCFTLDDPNNPYPSLLATDLDGATSPPAGSPEIFMNLGSSSLNLWRFHVDFVNPANTSSSSTPLIIPVTPFNGACGGGGTCVPQSGTTELLDSLGDRLMDRLAYRNLGDHETLVVNHSVTPNKQRRGPKADVVSGIRWYEIRDPNGTPVVYQQGTYAPDRSTRWMGSIATDKAGDIAVGYSVSSSSMFPAIRYTGRVPGDPLGVMEGEASIIEGAGSQLGLSRWGDYSSMTVDSTDDCTFFYTNEYLLGSGNFNWNTRIASFKFPGCQ